MRLCFVPQFKKDIARYGGIRDQVERRCHELVATDVAAEQLGEPCSGELTACRKIRVGRNYRMVYAVRSEEVWMIALGPRQNLDVYQVAQGRLFGLPQRPAGNGDA